MTFPLCRFWLVRDGARGLQRRNLRLIEANDVAQDRLRVLPEARRGAMLPTRRQAKTEWQTLMRIASGLGMLELAKPATQGKIRALRAILRGVDRRGRHAGRLQRHGR